MNLKGTKAVVAALIAILAVFYQNIASVSAPTWKDYVGALVAAVLAHQGVYWTNNRPKKGSPDDAGYGLIELLIVVIIIIVVLVVLFRLLHLGRL